MSGGNRLIHPQGQTQHFSLARGLASLGRGSDTNLVHMSDKEINGLKTLAARTGGSLTVNPHTGLYEAGWLENILPMVAGGVLAATGVGAPAAALLVAAADTAATKDWKSGLAAGLGAFGGAGVAAGLAGAGAGAVGDAAAAGDGGAAAIGSDVAGSTATGAASGATDAAGVAAGTPAAAAGAPVASDTAAASAADTTPATNFIPNSAASSNPNFIPNSGPPSASEIAGTTASGTQAPIASDITAPSTPNMPGVMSQSATNNSVLQNGSFGTNTSNIGRGLGQLTSNPGTVGSDVYASTGKIGLAGLAAPAAYNNYAQAQIPTPAKSYKYYSTTYNQGQRNPYAGELGQDPLTGQGYTSPTSSIYTPITGFAAGGAINPVRPILNPPPTANGPPGTGASQADQIAYYQSLINTPPNVMQPPSAGAQNSYLANLQNQITGKSPVPPAMGGTGSPPPGANTQPIQGNPSNAATQAGGYDPATQSYTGITSTGHPLHGSASQGVSFNPSTGTYGDSGPVYYPGDGIGLPGGYAGTPGNGAEIADGTQYQYAGGGLASLGAYSDGGQLLRGPGDGMSDSIPAQIGQQKAALANNEFVVPADVVSHLGNGSTDAGSQKLYKMLDRVRRARTGKSSQAPQINADKMLPA